MLDITTCPRCLSEVPAQRIAEGACPVCSDELADQLQSDNELRDNMRREQYFFNEAQRMYDTAFYYDAP